MVAFECTTKNIHWENIAHMWLLLNEQNNAQHKHSVVNTQTVSFEKTTMCFQEIYCGRIQIHSTKPKSISNNSAQYVFYLLNCRLQNPKHSNVSMQGSSVWLIQMKSAVPAWICKSKYIQLRRSAWQRNV